MRRDAVLAPAENGVKPVVAAAGVAARTGIAFVAGAGDVVEVRAARALQEIAADGRGIAQLRRGSRQKRFGHGREAPREIAIVRKLRIVNQCADAHAAIWKILDIIEPRKMGDVDEPVREADASFHQIEEIGASGEIDGARVRSGGDRFRNGRRPHVVEGLHATSLRLCASSIRCASSTASVMPL
jgi:hypothetical protein